MAFGTVPELIAELARRHGERIAVSDGARRMSFQALDDQRRRAAQALMAFGVDKGERVALWAGNSLDWIIAALALQSIGAVLVPLSTRLKGAEAAAIMDQAGARLVICDQGFGGYHFPSAILAATGSEDVRAIVLQGGVTEAPVVGWPGLLALADTVSEADLQTRMAAVTGRAVADIIFTSGTTGRPKGVPITHAQSLASCRAYGEVVGLTPEDVFAVVFPFAHNAGYRSGWLTALLHGARAVAVADTAAEPLLSLIQAEGVTYLPGVPTLHQAVLDFPERPQFDLTSLRAVSTGATTIPVSLIRRMREGYGAPVLTGYGLTEAAGTVTHCRIGDDDETVALTVGRPIPGMEVVILGAEGQRLAAGEAGEIAIRGETVTRGYFENLSANTEAFTADGFLRTGDVGVFDARGYLKITDRLKDMYIVGGFNCYPAEIERQLCQMPGVSQVAVVGMEDERLGQVGRAFVVLARGAKLTDKEVTAWARERMAAYKAPRRVTFLDALPLNATGKVAKDELRRRP